MRPAHTRPRPAADRSWRGAWLGALASVVVFAAAASPARGAEVPRAGLDEQPAPTRDACLRFATGSAGAAADPAASVVLAELLRIPDAPTVITAVESVPAAGDLPAYCRFKGTIAPQIHFELRLPTTAWNGKLLMQGCGGMCGWINMGAAEDSLARGYAVVNTDMGHVDPPFVALWALDNREAEADFAYRSTWATAQVAKALTKAYYSSVPRYTYFNGCSTGGRQGMVAAQRFPELFDGIIAGAPVLNQTGNGMLHLVWLARANMDSNGKPILSRERLAVVREHVLAACDRMDGVEDGIVPDPRACPWRPAQMACRAGGVKDAQCLSQAEVAALQKFYDGASNSSGSLRIASGGGLTAGSEYGWSPAFVTEGDAPGLVATPGGMMQQILQTKTFYMDPGPQSGLTIADFDFDRDVPRLALTEYQYNAQNPDLRRFRARGGKLILWHGWDDTEVPPGFSTDYYELAARTMGGAAETNSFFRLFMLPGVQHCRRGVGADAVDFLTALEDWVEKGRAPDALVAHRLVKEQSYLGLPRPRFPLAPADYAWRRPLYPYPAIAVYTGRGDWRDPANWRSRLPVPPREGAAAR